MTTMTREEEDRKLDLMEAYCDAMDAGDREKARELRKQIILYPETAMHMLRSIGKEQLIATDFDLSAATKAFGEGWMDEQPRRRAFR